IARLLSYPHPSPPEISTLSLHDALPISSCVSCCRTTIATALSPPRHSDASPRLSESSTLGTTRAPSRIPVHPGARWTGPTPQTRSEEHTSELQSRVDLVCRLLLEKKKR